MSKLYKASKNYEAWKSKHDPHLKPWIYPEQNTLPKLHVDEILSIAETTGAEVIDETDAVEEAAEEELDLKIQDGDD